MTTAESQILDRLDRMESLLHRLLMPEARLLARHMATMTPAEIRAENKRVLKAAKEKKR